MVSRHRHLILAAAAVLLAALALSPLSAPAAEAQNPPAGVTITGVDLHDGMILKSGSTFYLYGTMYGCGFQWGLASPWCGFGVATATSLAGPWSTPTRLFSPSDRSPFTGRTWQQTCGDSGAGCFNPRMVIRTGWGPNDGVPILWFNAPDDWGRTKANAYYALGCNSLTGPCGATAGAPYGTTIKPALYRCHDNGDFSVVPDPPRSPVILCTMGDQTLSSERLDYWGTGGVQGSGTSRLAGAVESEGPGAYRDARTGRYILTFNELNCGYCAGSPTSYATSSNLEGPYTNQANPNPAWGARPLGRRGISATSCGGQARTVTVLDGQPYQHIDLWLGTRNETGAGIHYAPLTYRGEAPYGRPHQPFAPWSC